MSANVAPNIVRNGLVLELDAANTKSYPGTGTSWTDLTANGNNGSLINSPTFNSANVGSIVFDGTNDYVDTNYTQQLGDFTIALWFNANATTPASGRILDKNYINGTWIGKNTSGGLNSWGGGVRESVAPYGIYITLPDGQWNYLVSIRSGTTHILYGNGITNTTSNTVSSTSLDTSILRFGVENSGVGVSYYKGNIASAQIYNRALSAAEVLQNYNALKSRFGL
jgi:hypothetical protein